MGWGELSASKARLEVSRNKFLLKAVCLTLTRRLLNMTSLHCLGHEIINYSFSVLNDDSKVTPILPR